MLDYEKKFSEKTVIAGIDEIYNNKRDKHYEVGRTLIFSKSLINKNIKNWCNKNLYLNIHDKQNNFILKY